MRMGHVAAGLLAIVVLLSLIAPAAVSEVMGTALGTTLSRFGWFYLLTVSGALVVMIYLAFGKHGTVRIGGPDAEPEFSRHSWLAMLFSAGMGIGLVFFGAAEPLSHLLVPPEGLPPETPEAARAAMRYAFFHWGVHPWAVYGLLALALAYFRFNLGKLGLISELLVPLLGRWATGRAGKLIDLLAIVATVGGVATSLGFGAIQISGGLTELTGLPAGRAMHLAVIGVATVLFLVSATSGVHRGVKYLSNANMVLAVLLFLALLVVGPSKFIIDTFTTTVGSYLDRLPAMSLRLTPFTETTWVEDWTVFYWAWWISWSPFVGSFIARISLGRTVREFVVGVLLIPCLVSFLWFATLGGIAIHQQLFEGVALAEALNRGPEFVLFAMFDQLPLPGVLTLVAIVLLASFFVTSADSATLVIASFANQDQADVGTGSKLTWGLLLSGIAVALLLSGGLDGLQAGAVLSALPFSVIICLVAMSLLKRLDADWQVERRRDTARRQLVDRMLAAQGKGGADADR